MTQPGLGIFDVSQSYTYKSTLCFWLEVMTSSLLSCHGDGSRCAPARLHIGFYVVQKNLQFGLSHFGPKVFDLKGVGKQRRVETQLEESPRSSASARPVFWDQNFRDARGAERRAGKRGWNPAPSTGWHRTLSRLLGDHGVL